MLDSSFFPDKENRIAEWARLAFTLSLGYDIDSETSENTMRIEIRQHTHPEIKRELMTKLSIC